MQDGCPDQTIFFTNSRFLILLHFILLYVCTHMYMCVMEGYVHTTVHMRRWKKTSGSRFFFFLSVDCGDKTFPTWGQVTVPAETSHQPQNTFKKEISRDTSSLALNGYLTDTTHVDVITIAILFSNW